VTGLVTDETEIDFEDESRCSGANEVRVLEAVEIYLPQP